MKVSILTVTYNHAAYIAQTLSSVLMQQVNFDYEIVVGDDFSTDGTREILLKFKDDYPDKINLLLHPHNLGKAGKYNFIAALNACKGEFIAILDGDDYWTDPLKLQKQVDFLEANPDYAICAHDVSVIKDNVLQYLSLSGQDSKNTFTIEDLAKGNLFATLSVVYRNGLIEQFPSWFHMSPIGDYVLHMLNARKGKIKFFPEIMGVYRLHEGGDWSEQPIASQHENMMIALSFLLTEDFDENVKALLRIQKYNSTTNYLKALLDFDPELFKTKLEELTIEYPQLGKEWLLALLIDDYTQLKEIRNKYHNLKNSRLRKYLSYVFKQLQV